MSNISTSHLISLHQSISFFLQDTAKHYDLKIFTNWNNIHEIISLELKNRKNNSDKNRDFQSEIISPEFSKIRDCIQEIFKNNDFKIVYNEVYLHSIKCDMILYRKKNLKSLKITENEDENNDINSESKENKDDKINLNTDEFNHENYEIINIEIDDLSNDIEKKKLFKSRRAMLLKTHGVSVIRVQKYLLENMSNDATVTFFHKKFSEIIK